MYNFDDPEDVARFHLNLLCGDIGQDMQDYIHRYGRDPAEQPVLACFAELVVALKKLNEATAPKAVTNG